ncbi:ARM repeat-containing protein [Annulohypoxylon maeteangense]|uniref:ARM repeat-containing protein n=1 Tax=Annulohypoxylon maeteangense TaxID=1927788 RepID=UPI002008D497|nr:ARM repeat-containing protein [Annulohypoxylon maeteangense]KAI0883363.1 ARM repeat-containing protein [Annulohypoxylon maeteangense]
MTTATRPNGFPNLAMNPPNDKASQPLASTFGHSTWQSNGIWGNSAIGGSLNTRRDVTGSRESDEHSPSATSGSAQLNTNSQAAPWVSRSGIWNQTGNTHQNSSSGGTSPTRTRDGYQHSFTEPPNNSHLYHLRQPVGQNGSAAPSRTMPPGPSDLSTSSFKYPGGFGDSVVDERAGSGLYASNGGSQLDLDTSGLYRRNSNDPTYSNLGHSRQNTLGSRQADSDVQTPSHRYDSNTHFPFAKLSKPQQTQRPSISGASVTLPSESGRTNAFAPFGSVDATGHDLEDTFNRSLTLEDSSDSMTNGYATNGHFNPNSQPFQFNPGSQPWQHDLGNSNSRAFGQNMQESWAEPLAAPLYGARRAPGERGSPAGSSYRAGMNSPRAFSGTPNPRADPWSRPGSRDPRLLQDLDRAQHGSQYLQQQQSGFYPPAYYNAGLSQFSAPYDQYVQNPSMRSQVQLPGYGLPVNYPMPGLPVPIRPSRDQDPGKGVRSVLLEEFRGNAKSNKRYELKDIYNHIVEFSGDQHGSRFIQEKLQTANSDEKDQVFQEIQPNTLQLMKDVFGNYVIQKFFEHGNQVQKKLIAAQMKGKVAELSTQMYACRVVQKALEHVLVEQQYEIVEELKPDIMRIVKDQNGNHVIQKIIQMVPDRCIPFIMDAFQSQIESLASHNYGCRVIQRILEHGTEVEKKSLMSDLHACAARLITDQYGNYVTQHIIAQGQPEDRQQVIQLVLQKLLFFSKHKYASNVVEKSIEYGTNEDRKAIRIQLTALHSDGTSPLQLMMKDQFGNYVIQKLMQHLEGPDRDSFIEEMRPHFANLKKYSTGRQITALDRLMSASSVIPGSGFATASGSPTTPSLLVEVNSSAPTPSLTMEQNSPESSSPPSTNSGMEEPLDEKTTKASPLSSSCRTVQVKES